MMPDSVQILESDWIGCDTLEEVYLSPSLSIVADNALSNNCQKVYGYETTENHAVADNLLSNGTGGTFVSLGTPYTVTYYGPGANSSFKTYTMGTLRRPVWKSREIIAATGIITRMAPAAGRRLQAGRLPSHRTWRLL